MKSIPSSLGILLFVGLLMVSTPATALDWTQNAYHDDGWSLGSAEFGFGDGDEETTLPMGQTTYYFRSKFLVDELENYSTLTLSISYDDGFVAYINGVEVARANMPAGTPSPATFAISSHEGGSFEDFVLPLSTLVENFPWTPDYRLNLSIEIHQDEGSSDDISFDAALMANGTQSLISTGSSWQYFEEGGYPPVASSDPLTLIQRPILNIPVIQLSGGALEIRCLADSQVSGWNAWIADEWGVSFPLAIDSTYYDQAAGFWTLEALLPAHAPDELYDLIVATDEIIDTAQNAVKVVKEFKEDFYFVHITDPHVPEHRSTFETEVYLENVVAQVNIMNPEFVLLTGDLVNRGYEDQIEIAQQLLATFEVPVFLTAGNHDIGDGRLHWWRYFGWEWLYSGSPLNHGVYTQDYSFNYGDCHFSGLEAYQNYVHFDWGTYGWESMISSQEDWLEDDLDAAMESDLKVLFFHYDFQYPQIMNIASSHGVDLALWGHLHYNDVLSYAGVLSLLTGEVFGSDGSFRLIRVEENQINAYPVLYHWNHNLTCSFDPINDGSASALTATITNEYNQRFENGLVKLLVIDDGETYDVDNGIISRIVDAGSFLVHYVTVEIQPLTSTTVTIRHRNSIDDGENCLRVEGVLSARSYPNPFNEATIITCELPRRGHHELIVYDLGGRVVKRLVDGVAGPGRCVVRWDGRNDAGGQVASGNYLYRLQMGDVATVGLMSLVR